MDHWYRTPPCMNTFDVCLRATCFTSSLSFCDFPDTCRTEAYSTASNRDVATAIVAANQPEARVGRSRARYDHEVRDSNLLHYHYPYPHHGRHQSPPATVLRYRARIVVLDVVVANGAKATPRGSMPSSSTMGLYHQCGNRYPAWRECAVRHRIPL